MPVSQISKRGFTLVELLVAISMIAVLAGILLPNFMAARDRAREAKQKQELEAIKNALRLYYNDNQSYPRLGSTNPDVWVTTLSAQLSGYMPGINDIGYTYAYIQLQNGEGFRLQSSLPEALPSENGQSQLRCGIGVGATNPDIFMLCAK